MWGKRNCPSLETSVSNVGLGLTTPEFSIQNLYYLVAIRGFAKLKKLKKNPWIELTPPTHPPHPNFFFLKPITDMDRTLNS